MRWRIFACLVVASCGGDLTGPGSGRNAVPLADLLARTWITAGQGGNCTRISTWSTFGADGSLTVRDIDDNLCSGLWLVNRFTGVYTLRDQILEMTLNGKGLGPPYLDMMTYPVTTDPVARFVERSPIIAGKLAASSPSAGVTVIDDRTYTSTDGAHYRRPRYVRMESAAGARIYEMELNIDVTVDPPLPLAAGQPCRVQVDFSLALFDAGNEVTEEGGTFRMTYDATPRATEPGWMRVMPRALEGLPDEQSYPAWLAMLQQAGLSTNHSERFARIFAANFGGFYLGYSVDDPHLLTESLPGVGRWQEATTPLPIE
jgi:hypothetical protein